jgi:hypothetical protein
MAEPFMIGALLGSLLLFFQGKKGGSSGPPGGRLPDPDTKDLVAVTEWKSTPQGMARYYRKEFIPSIAINLQSSGVVKVVDAVYKGSRVIVYRLNNTPVAGQSAIDIAKIGYGAGAAVMVTTNYWIKSGGPSFMAVIPLAQRAEWTQLGRQWAIEFDDQAGEATPTTTRKPPPKVIRNTPKGQGASTTSSITFDSNMTKEEMEAAAAFLLREDLAPEFYDQQAAAAESTAELHGGHPKCARMFRERAQELRDKGKYGTATTTTTPGAKTVPPSKKKAPTNWGTPPPAKEPTPPKETEVVVPPPPKVEDTVPPVDSSGPWLYQIRTDVFDTPYGIAKRLTGNGNRWREMMPLNPTLKEITVKGVTQVTPWKPGSQSIWLPADWKPGAVQPTTTTPTTTTVTPPAGDGGGGIFGPGPAF